MIIKKINISSGLQAQSRLTHRQQRGQAIVMAAFFAFLAAMMAFLVFNSGRAVNDKARLVNAADAAAYSAAVETARQMNFIAYTNRAMIVNQVAAGHMVSFMSELDYGIQFTTEPLHRLREMLSWVPIIGSFLITADNAMQSLTSGAISFGQALLGTYMVAQNSINMTFSSSQESALAALNSGLLSSVMQGVAAGYQNYDGELQLLDTEDELNELSALFPADDPLQTLIESARTQEDELAAFVEQVNPGTDGGAMISMVSQSVNNIAASRWYTDRGWNTAGLTPFFYFSGTKTGSTRLVATANGGLDWEAQDQFNGSFRVLGVPILSGLSVTASATGTELYEQSAYCLLLPSSCEGYKGIGNYLRISTDASGRPINDRLNVTAFMQKTLDVSTDGSLDRTHQLRKIFSFYGNTETEPTQKTLRAYARAHVYYERPLCEGNQASCSAGFRAWSNASRVEYANLFNPFWQVGMSVR